MSKKSKSLISCVGTTSLAAREALSMPLVPQIVLSADLRCPDCRERVAHMISKITGAVAESMVVDISEKKVTITSRSTVKDPTSLLVSLNKSTTFKAIRNLMILASCCT